jgi:hypothetical protein
MRPGTSFISYASLYNGLTGAGTTVSGQWDADSTGKIMIFAPSSPLQRASPYNIKLAMGSTSEDSSYLSNGLNVGFYTENIEPILGWNSLGKMLVLTGTNNNYTNNIYLRNTLNVTASITGLVGK